MDSLKAYINKILGNSFRLILPSFWWKKIFNSITDELESNSIKHDSIDRKIENLTNTIDSISYANLNYMLVYHTNNLALRFYTDTQSYIEVQPNTPTKVYFRNTFYSTDLFKPYSVLSCKCKMYPVSWYQLFSGRSERSIDLSEYDLSESTSTNCMFMGSNIESVDLTYLDFQKIVHMGMMFESCRLLKELAITHPTPNNESLNATFSGCSNLKTLTLLLDNSNVTNMEATFSQCSKIEYLYLGEKFFASPHIDFVNFKDLKLWVGTTVVRSLVENSYDRKSNNLPIMQLQLHKNTYDSLTQDQINTITNKGYNVTYYVES